MFGTDVGY